MKSAIPFKRLRWAFIALGLIAATKAFAAPRSAISPVVGSNAMVQSGDVKLNALAGVTAGALYSKPTGVSWDFETGLLYAEAGGRVPLLDFGDITFGDLGFFRLKYLQVPTQFKWQVTQSRGTGLSLKAGLILGYLMSADFALTDGGSTDVKESYKSTDVQAHLGGGYTYELTANHSLFADLSYSRSLVNIASEGSIYNEGFTALVGWKISL
jgi:hypothetical protein